MIKYLRYLVLAVIGLCLITVAMANRDAVTLQVLPTELAQAVGFDFSVQVPLFVVAFGGIVLGLLIGFVWEWLREHRYRAEAAARTKEVARLERVVAANAPAVAHKDDVLALLETPRKVN